MAKMRYKVTWVDQKGDVRVDWTPDAHEKSLKKLHQYIESVRGKLHGSQLTSQMPPKKTGAPNVGASR